MVTHCPFPISAFTFQSEIRRAVTISASVPARCLVHCGIANMNDESVDLGLWDKLTKVVLVLLVISVVAGIIALCVPLIQQNQRMRQRNLELETQIQREEETARHSKAALDAQRSDPKAVERLAREKLGYAKPGEVVIRFQEPVASTPGQ